MKLDPEKMRELVRRNTVPAVLPFIPELRLHLVTEETPLWRATDAHLEREGLASPYWAFAWAGGQSVARYVLDNPQLVTGKRVLDFAAGSGLVAIAAMKVGASSARATDIDAVAIEAARLNAALNDVAIDLVVGDVVDDPCEDIDVVLVGDVFFDRELAQRCTRWFGSLADRGVLVLVGDPGRYFSPKEGRTRRARYVLPESPEIDGEGVRHCDVFAVDPR
ncbi:MAG: methyltransferase [Myxococcota bacterium]|nr:50S ribosomal protein L11 methyltransferase [Myxococcota bacterium]